MPPKPLWLKRVRQIRAAVEATDVPFLDRAAVESLFGTKRRQAIHLVRRMAGFEVGNALVAPRENVLAFLDEILASGDVEREEGRRERVREALVEARRHVAARRVTFRIPAKEPTLANLPDGVRLAPGVLEVRCVGTQDLLAKLYTLAKAIASDIVRFEAVVDGAQVRPSVVSSDCGSFGDSAQRGSDDVQDRREDV